MTIRQRLYAIALFPLLMGGASAVVLGWLYTNVDRGFERAHAADAISSGTFELSQLINDPTLRNVNPRVIEQWKARRTSIDIHISEFTTTGSRVQERLDTVASGLKTVDNSFAKIIETAKLKSEGAISDGIFDRRVRTFAGRALVAIRTVTAETKALHHDQADQVRIGIQEVILWMVAGGILITATVVVFAFLIATQMSRRIDQLASAAGKLGEGDYSARVKLSVRDEIGAVGRAFDRMAASLQAAIGRRDQEIEARTLAEEKLADLNRHLEDRVAEREAQLRESERYFRTVIDNSPAVVMLKDREGRYLLVNKEFETRFGVSGDSIIGKTARDHVSTEQAELFDQQDQTVLIERRSIEYEIRSPIGDGEERVFFAIKFPVLDEDETVIGIGVFSMDVTESRHAAERLAETERLFLEAVNTVPVGIALFDAEDRLQIWNRLYEATVPESVQMQAGIPFVDIMERTYKARGQAPTSTNGPMTFEARIEHHRNPSSGIEIRLDDQWMHLIEHKTDSGGTLMVLSDVTKLKHYETKLEEAVQSLTRSNTELQQFAYVASHDLQEPLRMVGSYVQLLAKRYQDRLDEDANEFIGYAVEGVTRMQRLLEGLLTFSRVRTQGKEFEPVDLNTVVNGVLSDLKGLIEDGDAQVTVGPLPEILGDASQLGRVFQNLIGNAIKFRGEKPPEIEVSSRQADGKWVVSVRDNGIGIDPQFSEKIFTIFQRLHTRTAYPGEGLGLAIANRIVDRHGGTMWVESALGEGAEFLFTLPMNGGVSNDA